MTWHGQINRTIWELQEQVRKYPEIQRYRHELLRAHFLQRFEFDKAFHVPRDDRTFLFLQDEERPAILLLHGAQGTPAEMRELGNFLHGKGFTVYCPRLARADTREEMVSWESWVTQAEAALETVISYSRNAFIGGLSLGATIALILARQKEVRGVVLLAPALFPRKSIKVRLVELTRFLTPTLFYRLAGWNGEVMKAMDFAKKSTKKLRVPVLALQAADDTHLSPRGLKFIRRHTRRRRGNDIGLIPAGGHVITRGEGRDEVFGRVFEFMKRQSRDEQAPREKNSPTQDVEAVEMAESGDETVSATPS